MYAWRIKISPVFFFFLPDQTWRLWLGLVFRMLQTKWELADMVLCSPLSCLMKYCRSFVSDCLQLCVSTCILYVCFLRVFVFTALPSCGIARSNSPAMPNAPQRGYTSKPIHIHIQMHTDSGSMDAPVTFFIFYTKRHIHIPCNSEGPLFVW